MSVTPKKFRLNNEEIRKLTVIKIVKVVVLYIIIFSLFLIFSLLADAPNELFANVILIFFLLLLISISYNWYVFNILNKASRWEMDNESIAFYYQYSDLDFLIKTLIQIPSIKRKFDSGEKLKFDDISKIKVKRNNISIYSYWYDWLTGKGKINIPLFLRESETIISWLKENNSEKFQ